MISFTNFKSAQNLLKKIIWWIGNCSRKRCLFLSMMMCLQDFITVRSQDVSSSLSVTSSPQSKQNQNALLTPATLARVPTSIPDALLKHLTTTVPLIRNNYTGKIVYFQLNASRDLGDWTAENTTSFIASKEKTTYLRTQLAGLTGTSENRISGGTITLHQNSTSEKYAVRFSLKPGSGISNEEAIKRLEGFLKGTSQVKLALDNSNSLFYLREYIYWTDDGACPLVSCSNGQQCNVTLSEEFFCSCPEGRRNTEGSLEGQCNPEQPSTSNQQSSSNNLLALIVIPIVAILGVVVVMIILLLRKKRKEEEKLKPPDHGGREKVFQNTIGKSYSVAFNGSVFNGKAPDSESVI